MDRTQTLMFHPTLDDMIGEDHPARLFDEVLAACDWSSWEAHYELKVGQPAIHPRVVASAILYGMSRGLRSSRALEWACVNNLDFLWLVWGRRIDHSTFCGFRRQFGAELKTLFKQVLRLAMSMGLARLNEVALDGTKVKANSSRHARATAETIERRLAMLAPEIERMFAETESADGRQDDLYGEEVTPTRLPRELSSRLARKERLEKALEVARQRGADAKVPVADPESTVLPNKEGGFAPNYTPMTLVESHGGFIVGTEVLADGDEAGATVPMIDAVREDLDEKPERLLADGAFGGGENLAQLAQREVESYIPLQHRKAPGQNAADRGDPTRPVAEADWEKLPRRAQTGKLDRSAFVYDAQADCYYCPMGRVLKLHQAKDPDGSHDAAYRVYRCGSCEGCGLSAECIAGESGFRQVSRDVHEPLREEMDARMNTDEGRAVYRRRLWASETPNAVLKELMKLRRFLLRSLEAVRVEWLWAATAYNVWKLTRELTRLRGAFARSG